MKNKNNNESPLFSETILSTEDLFDEEEDFNNNGIDVDPNEVVLTKPVQSNTVEIPNEETLNVFETPLDENLNIQEAPLDAAEPVEDDLFMTEPIETPVQKTVSQSRPNKAPKVNPTSQKATSDFFEDTSVPNNSNVSYEDEPKKSFRKPLILGLMGLAVVGCLVWFMTGIFGSDNTVTKEDNLENQTNELILEPEDKENTRDNLNHNSHNQNNNNSTNHNNSNNSSSNNNNNNNNSSSNNNSSNNNNYNNTTPDYSNPPQNNNNSNNSNNNNYDQYPDNSTGNTEPDYSDDYVESPSVPVEDEYSNDYSSETETYSVDPASDISFDLDKIQSDSSTDQTNAVEEPTPTVSE